MDRRSLVIGLLSGGWAATLAFLLVPGLSVQGAGAARVFQAAHAEDVPGGGGGQQPNPNGPRGAGPTVNSLEGYTPRAIPNPGGGTGDSNNRAIAMAASIGGGQSAVWYFDTERERVLVYAFEPGSKGGLKLIAARHMDMDLRLSAYNDISDKSRMELKDAYDKNFSEAPANGAAGGFPDKKVEIKK